MSIKIWCHISACVCVCVCVCGSGFFERIIIICFRRDRSWKTSLLISYLASFKAAFSFWSSISLSFIAFSRLSVLRRACNDAPYVKLFCAEKRPRIPSGDGLELLACLHLSLLYAQCISAFRLSLSCPLFPGRKQPEHAYFISSTTQSTHHIACVETKLTILLDPSTIK